MSLYRPIYLFCKCNFFESKPGVSTSHSSASEDDYDYLFYHRHYSIVVSPHLKLWLVKIYFDFRSASDIYKTNSFYSSAIASLRTKPKWDCHPLNYLVILLLMIFHCTSKRQTYLYSTFHFNFILFLFILFFSFIYFIFGLMLGSQECIKSTVYFRLYSDNAGGYDSLRAKWDLSWSHSIGEENRWVQMGV